MILLSKKSLNGSGHNLLAGLFLFVLLSLAICPSAMGEANETSKLFDWEGLPGLSAPSGGAFVGVSGDGLVIAGGTDSGGLVWSDGVSVLEAGEDKWVTGLKLEQPLAYGASVSTKDGLILIGGSDGKNCYSTVKLLVWDKASGKIKTESLPDLPEPIAYTSAALLGDKIYVAGGITSLASKTAMKNFWSLDLSKTGAELRWEILEAWPDGPGRIMAVTAAQNEGDDNCVYVFGGSELVTEKGGKVTARGLTDGYRYNPSEKDASKRWEKILASSESVSGGSSVAVGQTHILFFTSSEATEKGILAYHTITNTWARIGEMPQSGKAAGVVKWAGKTVVVSEDSSGKGIELHAGSPYELKATFGIINYLTLGGYLSILVLVGVYFSRKEKSTKDFFMAGNRIPWWASGMSIYATTFSAISFMGLPAKVYATDWVYILGSVAVMPVIIFTIYLFIPFIRNLNVNTAYEYLERRFNLAVRLFGSSVFILFQLGRMAIMLLLPALALTTVTGISVQTCILTMGILCIIYTVMGGIEAVIWNDCLQVVVLTGGAIAILVIIALKIDGGFGAIITAGQADNKFQMANWSWDHSVATVWVVVIGNLLSNLQPYITDQAVIQRYMTTSDLTQAKKSLWFNFWILIPQAVLFFLIGTALYVFYKANPALLNPSIRTDAIVPWFVMQMMPAGVCGLVIAGIFAASMSSLDSSMHAVTTAITNDFYRRFVPNKTDKFYLTLARWLTGTIGLAGTVTAMIMAASNIPSLMDAFMALVGLVGGGISGIFLLGILTKRTNGAGAFIGAVFSGIMVFYCQTYTNMHFFLYGAVGLVTAMVVGYFASLMIPSREMDLTGLTVYTTEMGKQE